LKGRARIKFQQHKKLGLLLITPQLLLTTVFFIWPALAALYQSFFFSDAFGLQKRFAGFKNFSDLLKDPLFHQATITTFIIAFFITLVTMSFGLILANLVKNRTKSKPIYKSLLLWPYAVAPAVAAILWRFLCQPNLGWLSQLLNKLGVEFNYLIHAKQALIVIIISASWQQFSYNFLFFLAALQSIPSSILEAATLDGASSWHRFWHIIFPLISPTSFFLLITNLMYAFFDTFGIIDVLTNGGPGTSTTTLIYKIYQDGFVGMDLSSSAAQSIFLMIIVVLLTLIQFRYMEKKVHYA
jgi:sn-glycerol 3-phosphate transport system permease protein